MALENQPSSLSRKEEAGKPRVDGFKLPAKRIDDLDDIAAELASLSYLEIAQQSQDLMLINVESRDIQKNPYLFSIVYLKPQEIQVMYTYVPGQSPKKRRVQVLKYFLNLITLLDGKHYQIDQKQVYQILHHAMDEITEFVTADYDKIFAEYDNVKNEVTILQKKTNALIDGNDRLSKENIDLKGKNDDLVLRIRELETFSDEVITLKIQEWLSEHSNEINIGDFSKVHKMSETRVEQVLNRMITNGLIEAR
ncbi:Uncharacterised protein [Candidatus Gugararchaeum adminiculabundum]|nr:Uncharacterised protein [Candidatus Gugararchaeum adminiculabundum]